VHIGTIEGASQALSGLTPAIYKTLVDLTQLLRDKRSAPYVFGPLTPRRTIAATPATFERAKDAMDGGVDSTKARAVLVQNNDVQVAVTLDRNPIDPSCATAPGRPLSTADQLRVIRIKRSGLAPLAITVRDRRTTQRCLAQLPPIQR